VSAGRRGGGRCVDRTVLADRLHSLAIHVLRAVRREDGASGLSAPRLSALSVVAYAGPLTLGRLADAEQVRPPTITRLVQALEADGLVRREPDPTDARAVRIAVTPLGLSRLEAARRRRVAALAAMLDGLDAGGRAAVEAAVTALEPLVGPFAPPLPRR
jgi:DNA-binding MarR family transcriptional regulator